jgi:hypothetical protein
MTTNGTTTNDAEQRGISFAVGIVYKATDRSQISIWIFISAGSTPLTCFRPSIFPNDLDPDGLSYIICLSHHLLQRYTPRIQDGEHWYFGRTVYTGVGWWVAALRCHVQHHVIAP